MTGHTRSAKRAGSGDERRRGPAAWTIVAAPALWALGRLASWAGGEDRPAPEQPPKSDPRRGEKPPPAPDGSSRGPAGSSGGPARHTNLRSGRRLGSALVFASLFFAGAALSAIAGDTVSSLGVASGQVDAAACGDPAAAPAEEDPVADDPPQACETSETETGEAASDGEPGSAVPPSAGEEQPGATGPEPDGGLPPSGGGSAPDGGSEPSPPGAGSGDAPPPAPGPKAPGGDGRPGAVGPPLVDVPRRGAPTALDPEADGEAVVWLHRVLPDPTPPARRLAASFARELRRAAARERIPWSLLLAVVRAHGETGRVPVGRAKLARIAGELAAHRDALGAYRPWHVALRYSGRTAFADRTLALTRYNRAVGLRALVSGLAAAKGRLAARVLADRAIAIYAGGRADIAAGRTDVRVLVLLRYLRIAHGSVTVSSLTTGHGVYSRPGVVSAHTYGLAVDIAVLGGRPIAGNQEPHGLTERAVRDILLLPAELAPQQVISLLGLGGASFPLADHGDHIHVGY